MKGFDSAQRAYDNQSDPRLEDDGSEREQWEAEVDLIEVLGEEITNQLLWDYAAEDSLFKRMLDNAWDRHVRKQDEPFASDDPIYEVAA
jgi:hypothetical protein